MKKKIDSMKMGNPLDENTDIGTVISKPQLEKIKHYIELGSKEKGVTTHICNQLPKDPELKNGLFIQPVLFSNISNKSRLCQEEVIQNNKKNLQNFHSCQLI